MALELRGGRDQERRRPGCGAQGDDEVWVRRRHPARRRLAAPPYVGITCGYLSRARSPPARSSHRGIHGGGSRSAAPPAESPRRRRLESPHPPSATAAARRHSGSPTQRDRLRAAAGREFGVGGVVDVVGARPRLGRHPTVRAERSRELNCSAEAGERAAGAGAGAAHSPARSAAAASRRRPAAVRPTRPARRPRDRARRQNSRFGLGRRHRRRSASGSSEPADARCEPSSRRRASTARNRPTSVGAPGGGGGRRSARARRLAPVGSHPCDQELVLRKVRRAVVLNPDAFRCARGSSARTAA